MLSFSGTSGKGNYKDLSQLTVLTCPLDHQKKTETVNKEQQLYNKLEARRDELTEEVFVFILTIMQTEDICSEKN